MKKLWIKIDVCNKKLEVSANEEPITIFVEQPDAHMYLNLLKLREMNLEESVKYLNEDKSLLFGCINTDQSSVVDLKWHLVNKLLW